MSSVAPTNENAHYQVLEYGLGKHRILVIDSAIREVAPFVNQAEQGQFTFDGSNFYPGVRAETSLAYQRLLLETAVPALRDTFDIPASHQITLDSSSYSLTAQPESSLRPIQCMPHIDSPEPNRYAVVHYLSRGSFGGTGFYRHRQTGLEAISTETVKKYFSIIKQEAIQEGKNLIKYMNGSTHLFEQIAKTDFVFNRMVIYKSCYLHAGNLDTHRDISSSPTTGRLTANSLLSHSEG